MILHSSIHKLSLAVFIDCLVDQDLSGLVIEGKPSQQELQTTWQNILQQYSDLINAGTKEKNKRVGLIQRVTENKIKLQIIGESIQVLQRFHVSYFESQLKRLGVLKKPLDINNPGEYDKLLQSALSRSKEIELQLSLDQMALSDFGGETQMIKPSREYFDKILISLSDHAGYAITDQIYVSQFCERLKRFMKYADTVKK